MFHSDLEKERRNKEREKKEIDPRRQKEAKSKESTIIHITIETVKKEQS